MYVDINLSQLKRIYGRGTGLASKKTQVNIIHISFYQ